MKKIVASLVALLVCLPVFAELKQHNLEIAYEHSDYGYREPHMEYPIRDHGRKQGASLVYTRNSVVSQDVTDDDPSFASLELRYMDGKVDYDGYWSGGTELKMYDLKDYYVEAALKIGRYYKWGEPVSIWPYLGIAYRSLRNSEDGYYSYGGVTGYVYQRTSTYLFMPIGSTLVFEAGDVFKLSLNTEFDWLLRGTQNSHTGDRFSNANSASNKQNKGFGLRASVKAEFNIKGVGVFVEPFWRYWKIQNSEPCYYGRYTEDGGFIVTGYIYEPFNITREYGIRAGVKF